MADDAEMESYRAMLREQWIETRNEKDRTLLNLSAGGVALLATLLTTVGPKSAADLWLYVIAAAMYGVAIISAILMFDSNARLLLAELKGNYGDDKWAGWFDRILFWSFLLAVLFTLAVAVRTASAQLP